MIRLQLAILQFHHPPGVGDHQRIVGAEQKSRPLLLIEPFHQRQQLFAGLRNNHAPTGNNNRLIRFGYQFGGILKLGGMTARRDFIAGQT